ncbi:conserved Plasmodium protein, unknown function [Plasmodium gallinaceum]|uniref:CLASP N-terminal domain-containing protein n=1 Tax=Plasmodium gallinaceum TaxID=5849 RepID=A0A1J1GTQ2_PLAGA|nr:conserved Plasmodium protein, unknown function [Plasmodium gallinaceum]CRG94686.1 conserved Plasmodium protein, unknown function [Plasmodium gallinaceum]
MPTIGENKYRDNTSSYIDDARNYKRKSIDEQDDYSIVKELLYINNEKKNLQNARKENLYVNVELGSTRTSAIGLNYVNNSNILERKTSESRNIKNTDNSNDQNENSLESPLNELQKYQLTLLKKSNPSCPKPQKIIQNKNDVKKEGCKNVSKCKEKIKVKNEDSNINISIKENINERNNSNDVKMHRRDLRIIPRRNYSGCLPNKIEDTHTNDQKINDLKNLDIQDATKSNNFMNNREIIESPEIQKQDNDYYQNQLNYNNKIERTNSKSKGYDSEHLKNNFSNKNKLYKLDEDIFHNKLNDKNKEKNRILINRSVDNSVTGNNSFKCNDNPYESYVIEKRNQNLNDKRKINETREYVNDNKNILYDNLHKNMLYEISKNSYTINEDCMIYRRKNYEKNNIVEENDYNHSNNNQYTKKNNHGLNNTVMDFSDIHNDVDDTSIYNNKNEIKITGNNESILNVNIPNKKNKSYGKILDPNKNVDDNRDMKTINKNKNLSYMKLQDKGGSFDKVSNAKSCNSTPNKNMNTNRKNLNVISKIKNDKTITYITFEEITDFQFEITSDNINEMVTELLEPPKDQEWTKQIESLINLRKILKFYSKLFFESQIKELRKIVRSIVELLNSPRSCVSKNALLCLSEFYYIGKKKTDNTLDDIILPCLKKAHQTSVDFLSSAANNTLLSICNSCSESKLILYFIKLITSKQKTYNLICLRCLIAVIIKFDQNIIKFKEISKLIEAILECTAGGSAEIKCTARVALVVLDNIYSIKKLRSKLNLPMDTIKKIENLVERTSENEIDLVLGKIKFN